MDDSQLGNNADLLASLFVRAFEEKRPHDALLTAFASYLIARETKDADFEEAALVAITGAAERLLPSDRAREKDRCSFCGRAKPDVRIAAGPDAFICDGCVGTLSETFATSN
jgi:hypothetical protein